MRISTEIPSEIPSEIPFVLRVLPKSQAAHQGVFFSRRSTSRNVGDGENPVDFSITRSQLRGFGRARLLPIRYRPQRECKSHETLPGLSLSRPPRKVSPRAILRPIRAHHQQQVDSSPAPNCLPLRPRPRPHLMHASVRVARRTRHEGVGSAIRQGREDFEAPEDPVPDRVRKKGVAPQR